jgi:hypothetical protein
MIDKIDENLILYLSKFTDNNTLINLSQINKDTNNILQDKVDKIYENIWEKNKLKEPNPNAKKYNTKKSLVLPILYSLCRECYELKGKKRIYEKYICDSCYDLDKYKLICKKTVKEEYKIKDKDIEQLKIVFNVDNPVFRCSASMKLYNVKEIKDYIQKTYNMNYIEYKENLNNIKQQKINNKTNKEQLRKTKLIQHIIKEYKINENEANILILNCKYHQLYINDNKLTYKWLKEVNKRKEQIIKNNFVKSKYNIINKENYVIYNNNHYKSADYEKYQSINKLQEYVNKYELLYDKCKKYNIKVRDDSRLCDDYFENIFSKTEKDAEYIAQVLHEMGFFINNTNYRNVYYELCQEELIYYGHYDCDEISESTKNKVIKNYIEKHKNIYKNNEEKENISFEEYLRNRKYNNIKFIDNNILWNRIKKIL